MTSPFAASFRLAKPLELPNRVSLGKNWRAAAGKKSDARKALAWEVLAEIGRKPPQPLPRARIQVFRHGIKAPDHDNLLASVKGLLDVLQPASKRHPYGLGIIAGDDPDRLQLLVQHVRAATLANQCTMVEIREITPVKVFGPQAKGK